MSRSAQIGCPWRVTVWAVGFVSLPRHRPCTVAMRALFLRRARSICCALALGLLKVLRQRMGQRSHEYLGNKEAGEGL